MKIQHPTHPHLPLTLLWMTAALFCCTSPTIAATFGDFTYRLISNDTEVEITDYPTSATGDAVIPTEIEGKPVTSIGQAAFASCDALTSITIPDSVTSIGTSAFWNCKTLTNVSIGNNVTTIGWDAFVYCEALTRVTIPASVTKIYGRAFLHCCSLQSIVFEGDAPTASDSCFDQGISKTIYYYPNANGFGDSWHGFVTRIIGPVYQLINVDTEVEITDYYGPVTLIPPELEGKPVTSIGDKAFQSNSFLESITIPDSVTRIGDSAFNHSTLSNIIIGNRVTVIGNEAFFYCTKLTTVSLGNGVTIIGDRAFQDCPRLTQISLPDSVTEIGNKAFFICRNLAAVDLGSGVTSIGVEAFADCESLTSITIPASVTNIGSMAFHECTRLTRVYFMGQPPTIGISVFGWTPASLVIYYVEGTPGWGDTFAGRPTQPFIPGIWYRATVMENGWQVLDWFGWFTKLADPWIYHAEHAYAYISGDDTESFYLYDPALGCWFWTSDATYPLLYRYGDGSGWYWYYRGCVPGARWFYRFADGVDVPEGEM